MFMRMIGMAVGAALFGAIVNWGVNRQLPGAGDAVNQLLHAEARHGLGAAEIARLTDAVAQAVHGAFLVAALIALATLVVAAAFPRRLSPVRVPRAVPPVASARVSEEPVGNN